ncbi:uridine kinase [Microbispora sp. CA-102843]|uniref:uridine kinase n=1 Tax=Microbispora sp. CA-102843 TaxID=3239952 RepID=UPI003D90CE00
MSTAEVHLSVSTWRQPSPSPASPVRTALVGRIAERVLALGPGRLRVGVDGLTAAGKTSFGHELAEHLARAGRPVLRASLDDFKRPWRDRHLYDRESGEGYYRNAYDYDAAIALLLDPAGPDGSGSVALCSIDPLTQVDHSSVLTTAAPGAVTIVDGVFAFRPEIDAYWDLRVWMEVPPETSVRRGARARPGLGRVRGRGAAPAPLSARRAPLHRGGRSGGAGRRGRGQHGVRRADPGEVVTVSAGVRTGRM